MIRFLAIALFALSAIVPTAMADEDILIARDAYAFQTTSAQRNGAAFMQLHGLTSSDLTLTHASSDIAERIEIHTMSFEDGIMEMRRLDSLAVPTDATVTLEPTGKHIMLIGLKSALVKGESFPLTLHFAQGNVQTVQVQIVPPGSKGSHSGAHH